MADPLGAFIGALGWMFGPRRLWWWLRGWWFILPAELGLGMFVELCQLLAKRARTAGAGSTKVPDE